jgi:hypothetical protein
MRGISQSLKIALVGLGLAGALSGCTSLKQAMGLDKQPPDEFAIVTKAPLVVPPDFALKPPRPGAQDSQEPTASQGAAQTVFGKEAPQQTAKAGQSAGEVALLESAGADRVDDSIRDQVAADNKGAVDKGESLTDRLMFWKGDKEEATVNSTAEQDRIRANEAAGQPVAGSAQTATAQPAGDKPADEAGSGKKGGFFSHLWPF